MLDEKLPFCLRCRLEGRNTTVKVGEIAYTSTGLDSRNFTTEVHCNYLMLSGSELPEEDFQLFILNICGFVCFL